MNVWISCTLLTVAALAGCTPAFAQSVLSLQDVPPEPTAFLDPAARDSLGGFWSPVTYIPLWGQGETQARASLHGTAKLSQPLAAAAWTLSEGQADESGLQLVEQRYVLSADAVLTPNVRVFGSLWSAFQTGEEAPSTAISENRLDLHQAFVDIGTRMASEGRNVSDGVVARLGRQELAFGSWRIVSPREGTNVRLTFEGVRLDARLRGAQATAFSVRPVDAEVGVFDDAVGDAVRLRGLYLTAPLTTGETAPPGGVPPIGGAPPIGGSGMADAYLFDRRSDESTYAVDAGTDRRRTAGVRFAPAFGLGGTPLGPAWLDVNWEVAVQWGSFRPNDPAAGELSVRAWTLATETGLAFPELPLAPRLSVRANVASGDAAPNDDRLGTFDALYPRGDYFHDGAFVGPSNVVNVNPRLILLPHPSVSVRLEAGLLWRHRVADGLYDGLGRFYRGAEGSSSRRIAEQIQIVVPWSPAPGVTLQGIYEHVWPGPYLRDIGADRPIDRFSALLLYSF